MANYNLQPENRAAIIAECYDERMNTTITRTGPTIQQQVMGNAFLNLDNGVYCVEAIKMGDEVQQCEEVEILQMRSNERELTKPIMNTCSWMNPQLQLIAETDKCRQLIYDRIEFEVKHFRILRLDAHLLTFEKAMSLDRSSNEFAFEVRELLVMLNNLDLREVCLAQITFQFPQTVKYCVENNLPTLATLPKDEFIDAMWRVIRYGHVFTHFLNIQSYFSREGHGSINAMSGVLSYSINALSAFLVPENLARLAPHNQHALAMFILEVHAVFAPCAELIREPELSRLWQQHVNAAKLILEESPSFAESAHERDILSDDSADNSYRSFGGC